MVIDRMFYTSKVEQSVRLLLLLIGCYDLEIINLTEIWTTIFCRARTSFIPRQHYLIEHFSTYFSCENMC